MRDPMSWALPAFRAFGIPVKVHVLFFVVTLGLFFRQVSLPDNVVGAGEVFLFSIVLLFGIILLHELGHCFGGRAVGGEPQEILIWPLGGLAFVDTPQHWKAHTLTAAAGPATNALLCFLLAIPLFAAGLLPPLNPISNPYAMELHNYRNGRTYTSQYGLRAYQAQPATAPPVAAEFSAEAAKGINEAFAKRDFDGVTAKVAAAGFQRAVAPGWAVWVGRAFWLSWAMLLINLLPAYPLDGGQILQGLIWARSDYRQGITVAAYSGFVVALLLLVLSFSANESFITGASLFMMFVSANRLNALETDDGAFGYDFSAGYTSLERDEPRPRRAVKKQGFLKRWLRARAARRMQQEVEARQRDEERFDLLLGKVHQTGKASLTDEERRFMERVSARYRNRS